jgi:hypothetical protein
VNASAIVLAAVSLVAVADCTNVIGTTAGVTVRVADPEIVPDTAVIVVVPGAAAVASPWLPAAPLTVATPVADELHVTDVVRLWVPPLLYVPVAVNCTVVPAAIDGVAGVTAMETSATGLMVSVADVLLPSVAVNVTPCDAETVPAVAANVAVVAAAGTVTEAGTVSSVVSLAASVTTLPPVGAGWVNVIVHVLETPDAKVAGAQDSDDTLGPPGATVIVAVVVLPPSVAVRMTVWDVATDPAVAVKVVEVAPAGTVTEAGTDSAVVLFDAVVIVLPPLGAGCVSVTVHVVAVPVVRLVGTQTSDDTLRLGVAVTVAVAVLEPRVTVTVTV